MAIDQVASGPDNKGREFLRLAQTALAEGEMTARSASRTISQAVSRSLNRLEAMAIR